MLQNHRLFPKVDWERVEAGNYAIVDPVNPGVILYLSEQDYIVMVRVAITSNRTLKVLAGPSETRPETTSTSSSSNNQKSPPPRSRTPSPWGEILNLGYQTSQGRRGKRRLLNIFSTRLSEFLSNRKVSTSTQTGTRGISMVQLSVSNIRQWFSSWHEIVSWWSRGSSMTTVHRVESNSFAIWLTQVLKRNGINHLIARMKIMLFVVNSYLGGRKLTSTQSLGFRIRLRNGLPAHLPLFVRSGIRAGNRHYIHIWTSMLFSYKGILGTWKEPHLATGSIQAPHPPLEGNPTLETFSEFCKIFWELLWFNGIKRPDLRIKNFFFSTHAGPNHPVTILGAGLDAYLWASFDALKAKPGELLDESKMRWLHSLRSITGVKSNYIREWLEETKQLDILLNFRKTAKMFALNQKLASAVIASNQSYLLSVISTIQTLSKATKKWISTILGAQKETTALVSVHLTTKETKVDYSYVYDFLGVNLRYLRWNMPTLQRLHNLYEAAGKVRTIAIVDYWTNFVLKPLHDWMFKVLTLLPQDATFNQEGRVRDFASRGYRDIWSYDLKSATDLIPLALYRALFSKMLPEKILDLWFKLLVDRDFTSPKSTLKCYKNHPRTVRYTTGQPMGALTSWASMALVHHALVLYSAMCVGACAPSTLLSFRDYMVLGDDVVIANSAVAAFYQALMKELHVPLSLAKSHISEAGMFNFANQTYVGAMNCSPVSLREEVNANSLAERLELALRLFRRDWKPLDKVWVSRFCRLLLPQRVWALLTPDIRNGKVPLVIRWILAVLLTPGTTRYGWAGYGKVALETFLGAQLRRGDLFSMSLDRMGDLIDRHRSGKILIGILNKWAARIYASFLSSRKTISLDYKNWVTRVVSVDLEWIFDKIMLGSVQDALTRWTEQYRFPLKEVVVATGLSQFNLDDVEAGTGKPWADLVGFVSEAEAALPVVPDFKQTTLDVLTTLEVPMGGPDHEHTILVKRDLQARESLLRVTNLLGMVDHLATGTPDFEEAWDFSQLSTGWFSKPPAEK